MVYKASIPHTLSIPHSYDYNTGLQGRVASSWIPLIGLHIHILSKLGELLPCTVKSSPGRGSMGRVGGTGSSPGVGRMGGGLQGACAGGGRIGEE